jgi:predicted TPR repeat methyltransferase
LLAMDETDAARQEADALLAADPANAVFQFWAAVARGETPPHQPPEMVTHLYDGFADLYDQHVMNTLKYTLPVLVANRIVGWHPDRVLNLLDLGCGTGLLGGSLRRIKGAMTGVDVSLPMIEQAARRSVYDTIHQVDLLDALAGTSDAEYEVIAALDVFIYAGALETPLKNAHRILKPGGRLVFSCESATEGEPDLVLRSSLRYAHQRAAVEAQCKAAGFAEVEIESLVLREEDGAPVNGFLVVARKAT